MKSNCICKKSEIPFRKFPLGENYLFSQIGRSADRSIYEFLSTKESCIQREKFSTEFYSILLLFYTLFPYSRYWFDSLKKRYKKKEKKMKKENERTRRLILHKWIDTGKTSNEVFIASSTRVHLSYRIGEICNKSGRVTHARRFIAGILIKNIF